MSQGDLLGPLVDAIETVKQRIQEHGASLRENETRTRIALIDPILQALGWDVSDPSMVTPEFPVSAGRADYALFGNRGHAIVALEAKRLGESLVPHRQQMVNYANTAGIGYAGLTDGDNWEVYRVFTATPLPLNERVVMSTSILGEQPHESALKLLSLWRTNVESGQPQEAQQPVEVQAQDIAAPEILEVPPQAISATPQDSVTTMESSPHWVPLTDFRPTQQSRPSRIRFADDKEQPIVSYPDILLRTIEWLIGKGFLKKDSLPFTTQHGATIANSTDTNAQGDPLRRYKQVGYPSVYVNTDLSRVKAKSTAIAALRLLKQNPGNVYVQLGD